VAKIRNVSGEARHVPELNWKAVSADEVVDVPDDRADAYTCQTTTWALVADTKTKGA
jgi:hypothetical protein